MGEKREPRPERRRDDTKREPRERRAPTEEEVDQTVEDTFPASDPPSYNPGRASPGSSDRS